jgi:plasmid stabilization system protein ParE
MRRYTIRFKTEALADLEGIQDYVSANASPLRAQIYLRRIRAFIEGMRTFPERGTVRNDLARGLRIVGFERRVAVAFTVAETEIVILRLLYGGRSFDSDDFQ